MMQRANPVGDVASSTRTIYVAPDVLTITVFVSIMLRLSMEVVL